MKDRLPYEESGMGVTGLTKEKPWEGFGESLACVEAARCLNISGRCIWDYDSIFKDAIM